MIVDESKRDKVLNSLLKNGIEASPMYIEHGMNFSYKEYLGSYKVSKQTKKIKLDSIKCADR